MAKNTKQSKQKKSVLNKLGGLSKRSKFIVVVLIFAVLGGGYLTYKSFAAIPGGYSINPGELTPANALRGATSSGCSWRNSRDASKNNATVVIIYCPPNGEWSSYEGSSGFYYPSPSYSGTWSNCVTAKGVGKIRINQSGSKGFYITGNPTVIYINDSSYKSYCSKPISVRAGAIDYQVMSNVIGNKDATNLTIAYYSQQYYAPGAAPVAPNGK